MTMLTLFLVLESLREVGGVILDSVTLVTNHEIRTRTTQCLLNTCIDIAKNDEAMSRDIEIVHQYTSAETSKIERLFL